MHVGKASIHIIWINKICKNERKHKKYLLLGTVAHACNHTWEAKAGGGVWIQGQPEDHNAILSQIFFKYFGARHVSSTWKAEAGGLLLVPGMSGLHDKQQSIKGYYQTRAYFKNQEKRLERWFRALTAFPEDQSSTICNSSPKGFNTLFLAFLGIWYTWGTKIYMQAKYPYM